MPKPRHKQCKRADELIAVLRAFKRGETIQKKAPSTQKRWVDFDLRQYMEDNTAQYRPKPKRK